MTSLASAREYQAQQQRLAAEGLRRARLARFGPLDALVAVVAAVQMRAAEGASRAIPAMLEEQGIDSAPVATPVAYALGGVAMDGRPLSSLLDLTRAEGFTPARFDRLALTQFSDAARQSEAVGIAVRPKATRYTRMLVLPSCSRCAQLAGQQYRASVAFRRHPGCDCRHIPSNEAGAGDLTTDPRDYFDSLPTAEQLALDHPDLTVAQRRARGLVSQEDVFTKAGAESIRLGADISQVVNARAGMSTAQVALRGPGDRWTAKGRLTRTKAYGQDVFTTTEARRGRKVRLMPESIIELADSPADALRLLKAHGYIG